MVVSVAAVVGAVIHARGGRVRLKTGAMWKVLGVAGSYAGSLASAAVPANVLLAGFGLLMLAVAAVMILRRPGRAQPHGGAATSPGLGIWPSGGGRDRCRTGHRVFGVGGGFVVVPALVLVIGFDMPNAAGTSLVVITVNCAAALAIRASLQRDPGLGAGRDLAGAVVLGALAGGTLAGQANPQRRSAAFAVVVV